MGAFSAAGNTRRRATTAGVAVAVLAALVPTSGAGAGEPDGPGLTTRAGLSTDTELPQRSVGAPALSHGGRFVAFSSEAALLPGDTNGTADVFVRDRDANGNSAFDEPGTTALVRISSSLAGGAGDGASSAPAITPDGRFVAFQSYTSNLVADNGGGGVFVRDRDADADGVFDELDEAGAVRTERVSRGAEGEPADGESGYPSLSADGRFVAFHSDASNIAAGILRPSPLDDVYVFDRSTGTAERVSVASDGGLSEGHSQYASVSADGRFVAFTSTAGNLVADDTNDTWDVFVRDRQAGTTQRASVATDGGEGYDFSTGPAISADGARVAFQSGSDNLVAGDTNGRADVFVRDLGAGTTQRLTNGNGDSLWPRFADGSTVVFQSAASNIVAGDTNAKTDVFRSRAGATERVSVTPGGAQANNGSGAPAVSGDGHQVGFVSLASNLAQASSAVAVDSNSVADVYVRGFPEGGHGGPDTRRMSVTGGGEAASDGWYGSSAGTPDLSRDGRYVVFESDAQNLVPGDANGVKDVFVRDRKEGRTVRVSVAADGGEAGGESSSPSVSDDGRFVTFTSSAANLVPGSDGGLYLRDRDTDGNEILDEPYRTTTKVIAETGGWARVTPDGEKVVFDTYDRPLGTDDDVDLYRRDPYQGGGVVSCWGEGSGGARDVYTYAISSGGQLVSPTLVSPAQFDDLSTCDEGTSFEPTVSDDGSTVVFTSWAENLLDTLEAPHPDAVYVRSSGATRRLVPALEDVAGVDWNDQPVAAEPGISGDGQWVAYNHSEDRVRRFLAMVDVREVPTSGGAPRQVSATPDGSLPSNGGFATGLSYPSPDYLGNRVAFHSWATNLVGDDGVTGTGDAFVRDWSVSPPVTRRVGRTACDAADPSSDIFGNGEDSTWPAVSGDGRYVAFDSNGPDVVPGDENYDSDLFVRDIGVPGASERAPEAFLSAENADALSVTFDASESCGTDRTISGYTFDFGDGAVETRTRLELGEQASSAFHEYRPGTHTATLTVVDGADPPHAGTTQVRVVVKAPPAQVDRAYVRAEGTVATETTQAARRGRFGAVLRLEGANSAPYGAATYEVATETRVWRVTTQEWSGAPDTLFSLPESASGGSAVLHGPCDVWSMPRAVPVALPRVLDRRHGTCEWRFSENPRPGRFGLRVTGDDGTVLWDVPETDTDPGPGAGVRIHTVGPEEFQDAGEKAWDDLRAPWLANLYRLRDNVAAAGNAEREAARARALAAVEDAEPGVLNAVGVTLAETLQYAAFLGVGFFVRGCLTEGDLAYQGTGGDCVLRLTDVYTPTAEDTWANFVSIPRLRNWFGNLQWGLHNSLLDTVTATPVLVALGLLLGPSDLQTLYDWLIPNLSSGVETLFQGTVYNWLDTAESSLRQVQQHIRSWPHGTGLQEKVAALTNLVYGSAPNGQDDPAAFGIDDVTRWIGSARELFGSAWEGFWGTFPASLLDGAFSALVSTLQTFMIPVIDGIAWATDSTPGDVANAFWEAGDPVAWWGENVGTLDSLSSFGRLLIDNGAVLLQDLVRRVDVWGANLATGKAAEAIPEELPAVDGYLTVAEKVTGVDFPDWSDLRPKLVDLLTSNRDETFKEKLPRLAGEGLGLVVDEFFGLVANSVNTVFDRVGQGMDLVKAPLLAALGRAIAFFQGPAPYQFQDLVLNVVNAIFGAFQRADAPIGGVFQELPQGYFGRACDDGWAVFADVVCRMRRALPEWASLAGFTLWSRTPLAGEAPPYLDGDVVVGSAHGSGRLRTDGLPLTQGASFAVSLSQGPDGLPRGSASYTYDMFGYRYAVATSAWDAADFSGPTGTLEDMDAREATATAQGPCRAYRVLSGAVRVRMRGERRCTWTFLRLPDGTDSVGVTMEGDSLPVWEDVAPLQATSGSLVVSPFQPPWDGLTLAADALERTPVVLEEWGPRAFMQAWSPNRGLLGLASGRPEADFEFRATSLRGTRDDAVDSYEWDFDGDGSADRTTWRPDTVHTYGEEVSVVPRVRVVDTAGEASEWDAWDVAGRTPALRTVDAAPVVRMQAWAPEATAFRVVDGLPSTVFTFSAEATDDGPDPVASYEWDFDGDGTADEATAAPTTTHGYGAVVSVVPKVRARDSAGKVSAWDAHDRLGVAVRLDTVDRVPAVVMDAWSPMRTFGADGRPRTTFAFRARGVDDSGLDRYEWDFDGDGVSDAATAAGEATHRYDAFNEPVSVVPRVRVLDDTGQYSTWDAFDFLGAVPRLDTAKAAPVGLMRGGAPASGRPATTFTFTASYTDPDAAAGGRVEFVEWDLNGNGAVDLSGPVSDTTGSGAVTATHAYQAEGTFRPGVRFVDDDGEVGQWSWGPPVEVRVQAPRATLVSWTPCARLLGICGAGAPDGTTATAFTLQASWVDPDAGAGGRVVAAEWDFDGDGAADETVAVDDPAGAGTASVSHVYAAAGRYRPQVRFRDDDGAVGAWDRLDVLGAALDLDVS